MTTIAYKGGIIAVDSRIVRGSMIVTDCSKEKFKWVDGHVFFMAGVVADYEYFIESFFAGKPSVKTSIDVAAFVFDEILHDLYYSAVDNELHEFWKCKLDKSIPAAIGSGSPYALTAMDCSRSAQDAVRMASKRDTDTGGEIIVYDMESESFIPKKIKR